MRQVKIKLNGSIVMETPNGDLSASFAEHLGGCTYGSPYEPGHPSATAERLRGEMPEHAPTIATAYSLSDRIGIMQKGKVAKVIEARTELAVPQHPYSRQLRESVPTPDILPAVPAK
jgi:hypothetical protein